MKRAIIISLSFAAVTFFTVMFCYKALKVTSDYDQDWLISMANTRPRHLAPESQNLHCGMNSIRGRILGEN